MLLATRADLVNVVAPGAIASCTNRHRGSIDPMAIKTVQDLADWADYRKQTSTDLKSLEPGGSVHVSVDDHEFQVAGKAWQGRIVLVGAKGDTAMTALKRDGIVFRSGTGAVVAGGTAVQVSGLAKGLLTAANKTLAKMSLAFELVVASGEGATEQGGSRGADDASPADEESEGEGDAAADAALAKRLHAIKRTVRDRLPAVLAANPANKAALVTLTRSAADCEKRGDVAGAVQALEQLIAAIDAGQQDDATTAEPDEPDGRKPDPQAGEETDADVDAEVAANAEAARAEVATIKGPLLKDLKEATARQPDLREEVLALVRRADALEKAADFAALLATYDELRDLIDGAAPDEGDEAATDAEAEAATGTAADEVKATKAAVLQRIRDQVAAHPEQREEIAGLVRRADQSEKAGDFEAVLEVYGEIDALIAEAAAEPEEDEEEAANSVDIASWQEYRTYLRPRILAVGGSPDEFEPFFVSKKKFDFDNGGKRLRRHIVLAGTRTRAMARRLVREGVKMLEGGCYLREDDSRIIAEGVKKSPRKAAAKTLKVLKVGRKLGEAEDQGQGQAQGQGEAGGGGKSTSASLSTMRMWSKAKQKVDSRIQEVCSHLRDTNEQALIEVAARLASAMDTFGGDLTTALVRADRATTEQRAEALPAVLELLDRYGNVVQDDPLLAAVETNPLHPVKVRRPLLAAFREIGKCLQGAAG